jgi:hypothetical protein
VGNEFGEQNPYQAPAVASFAVDPNSPTANQLLLKKFRSQIHALGGFWIIIGVLVGLAGGAITLLDVQRSPDVAIGVALIAITGAFALFWITVGVLACRKAMPAVYVGLVCSYLALLAAVVGFSICPIVIFGAAILQAHRVIRWANDLKTTGIPLTMKPLI